MVGTFVAFHQSSQRARGEELRWSAAGVLEAERSFRKIVGYRAMPMLVAALRAHEQELIELRPLTSFIRSRRM
jgi:hypothetical protein